MSDSLTSDGYTQPQSYGDILVLPTLLLLDIDPESLFQAQHRRQVLVELNSQGFCKNISNIAPRFYVF